MKQRIVLFVTTLLLAFVLAACGGQITSKTQVSQGEMADTVSLTKLETEDNQTEPDAPEEKLEKPDVVKTLVAYFSRAGENYGVGVIEKGNTEVIAEMIASEVGADTFRIQTVNAYPDNYDECTEVAKQEKDSAARPELASSVANFEDYDVIYLGYPIWYGDMPMAVYTFLESYDFAGKTILPFCTHAGSGLSSTVSSIQSTCSGATVLDGLAIAGTTVQNNRDAARGLVETWLDK